MGFNTTVIVLNDALGSICGDHEFGKNLTQAIMSLADGRKWGVDVPAYSYVGGEKRGVFANAATVIESHHADMKALVAVGGNCGVQLGNPMFGDPATPEGRLALLKQLASDLGYDIRKKRSKR